MPSGRNKVFRDSVHGYIEIPENWCRLFIDTPIFQRLRRIEQTSIRCLYPCATHNRFVHSLGTYHLGCRAARHLLENSAKLLTQLKVSASEQKICATSFSVACLMHDCAHAPFSHACEHHYDIGNILTGPLLDVMNDDPDFSRDWVVCEPSPHEKASAIILRKHYDKAIREVGGDPALVARMIIGCLYDGPNIPNEHKFRNTLILLLKSEEIDVDKLDYIVRDTWASGVNNVSIDVDRLLAALEIMSVDGRVRTVFRRTAMSVIQQVVDARNFIYRWIVGHHRVAYDNRLLELAVDGVADELAQQSGIKRDQVLAKLFSIESFDKKPITIGQYSFSLVADADMIYLFKLFEDRVPSAREWLDRGHEKVPVWKSYAEFKFHFPDISMSDCEHFKRNILNGLLDNILSAEDIIIALAKTKTSTIREGKIVVKVVDDKTKSFSDLLKRSTDTDHDWPFFYLYIPRDVACEKTKNSIIALLKQSL